MPKQFTVEDKFFLNQAFSQILRGAGLPNGLPYLFGDEIQLATTVALNFWVDTVNGNDSNSGAVDSPFKTITAAIESLPIVRRHAININVQPGTYAETIRDPGMYESAFGSLTIKGTTWNAVTPATGAASGTFTSVGSSGTNDKNTAYMTGAGWTVNDLRGKFLQVTSGSLNGRFLPIASNSATSVDIAFSAASLNGATFLIATPAAIITRTAGAQTSVSTGALGNAALGLTLRNLTINPGTFYGVQCNSNSITIHSCNIINTTFAGVIMNYEGMIVTVQDTFIANTANGCYATAGQQLTLVGTVINGGQTGIMCFGLSNLNFSSGSEALIQNASVVGISLNNPIFVTGNRITVRNNALGMQCQNTCWVKLTTAEFINNTSHGILLDGSKSSGGFKLTLSGGLVTGNGGDGIRVVGSHASVQLDTAANVAGNTGWGIKCTGLLAAFTNITFSSDVTMATNTAGDITLDDGVTTSTIAAVRAAAGKTITDANRFNRVVSA